MLPWLLRTATFTASNLTRATRRYKAALRRLPAGDVHPDHAGQLDDGDAVTALRGLSPIDQEVLTLCVLEGVRAEDAADHTPVGGAKPGAYGGITNQGVLRFDGVFAGGNSQ